MPPSRRLVALSMKVVRAELEENASLSVPRDRDGAEAEAVCER
jgi:hypothetical protein